MGNSYMKILQKGLICVPWEKSNRIQGWKDMGMKKKTLFFFGVNYSFQYITERKREHGETLFNTVKILNQIKH